MKEKLDGTINYENPVWCKLKIQCPNIEKTVFTCKGCYHSNEELRKDKENEIKPED
jgi:hypothetical protein